jgi:hypothetical protein
MAIARVSTESGVCTVNPAGVLTAMPCNSRSGAIYLYAIAINFVNHAAKRIVLKWQSEGGFRCSTEKIF